MPLIYIYIYNINYYFPFLTKIHKVLSLPSQTHPPSPTKRKGGEGVIWWRASEPPPSIYPPLSPILA